nr:plastocyanin/azurin family copper-binding protein [Agrobacterium vitis]
MEKLLVAHPWKLDHRSGDSGQCGGRTPVTIKNAGELDHEFVLDQEEKVMEHKAVMEKFPDMEHDDPNAIRLAAGKSGEIIWKFTNDGTFKIACLVPGHYDAGMHGDVTVAKK